MEDRTPGCASCPGHSPMPSSQNESAAVKLMKVRWVETLAITQYKTLYISWLPHFKAGPSSLLWCSYIFEMILLVFNENLISNFSKHYVISKGKMRVVLREKNCGVLSGTQGCKLKVDLLQNRVKEWPACTWRSRGEPLYMLLNCFHKGMVLSCCLEIFSIRPRGV